MIERHDSVVTFDRQLRYRELRHARIPDVTSDHERAASQPLLAIPDALASCIARGGWQQRAYPMLQRPPVLPFLPLDQRGFRSSPTPVHESALEEPEVDRWATLRTTTDRPVMSPIRESWVARAARAASRAGQGPSTRTFSAKCSAATTCVS